MRFSYLLASATLLLAAPATSAQDGEGGAAPAAADQVAASPEPEQFRQDKPCMDDLSDELERSFGEPAAWPAEGQTLHTPAGLTVFERPVSYVLLKRGGAGGKIDEIGYRLQGMLRQVGQPHDSALLKAFDAEFKGSECASSKESSCGVIYRNEDHAFSGAEIGSGEVYVSREARGPMLALVKDDYDLLDADPVFLVCFYRGG